jgi:uncharacterized protein Yka (UPF0111/DUF47 family)
VDEMARKPIEATVTDAVASTQNIAEALALVTDLTRAARTAADLSIQLYALVERVEDHLDRLAPAAGRKRSSSESKPPVDLSVQLYPLVEHAEDLLDRLAPAARRKTSFSESKPRK